MTPEERKRQYNRQYARDYRREGFGAVIDKRYRDKHAAEIRAKDRLRKARLRKQNGDGG